MTADIYLDNSATTKVRKEVIDAMLPYLMESWGNPSSIHESGRQARKAIEHARAQVAKLINAKPSEIFFSPGGTASNNTAILGRAKFVEERNLGRHLITTSIEHSSALSPAKHLRSQGWMSPYSVSLKMAPSIWKHWKERFDQKPASSQ